MKRYRQGQTGFSLTELMIAMLLGLLLTAGMLELLELTMRTHARNETLADLEERAAFALAELEHDIALAGFWGLHSDAKRIDTNAAGPIRCRVHALRDEPYWVIELESGNDTTAEDLYADVLFGNEFESLDEEQKKQIKTLLESVPE